MARIVIKSRDSIHRAQAFATTWMSDCSNCRVIWGLSRRPSRGLRTSLKMQKSRFWKTWRYLYVYLHTHTHTHTQYVCKPTSWRSADSGRAAGQHGAQEAIEQNLMYNIFYKLYISCIFYMYIIFISYICRMRRGWWSGWSDEPQLDVKLGPESWISRAARFWIESQEPTHAWALVNGVKHASACLRAPSKARLSTK